MDKNNGKIENSEFLEIEENVKEEKDKRGILILTLGITTIVVALIGASFAWFAATINNIKGNESVMISAAILEGVTYQASDNLTLMNALPGDSTESTFTITNPNEAAKVRYSLKFVSDVNDFTSEAGNNQLIVTISGGDIIGSLEFDFTDGTKKGDTQIITDVDLLPKESDVYMAKLEFRETGTNQISNQKKNFAGHIEITQAIVVQ